MFEHKALANEWILKAKQKADELGVKLTAPALFDVDDETALEISDRTADLDGEVGATGMLPRMDHIEVP